MSAGTEPVKVAMDHGHVVIAGPVPVKLAMDQGMFCFVFIFLYLFWVGI